MRENEQSHFWLSGANYENHFLLYATMAACISFSSNSNFFFMKAFLKGLFIHVFMYLCIYVFMYLYIYVFMYLCIYVFISTNNCY